MCPGSERVYGIGAAFDSFFQNEHGETPRELLQVPYLAYMHIIYAFDSNIINACTTLSKHRSYT